MQKVLRRIAFIPCFLVLGFVSCLMLVTGFLLCVPWWVLTGDVPDDKITSMTNVVFELPFLLIEPKSKS